jgi:hypothetical protein
LELVLVRSGGVFDASRFVRECGFARRFSLPSCTFGKNWDERMTLLAAVAGCALADPATSTRPFEPAERAAARPHCTPRDIGQPCSQL